MQIKNFMSTLGIRKDLNEPLNSRAKLDTGTHCNYRCSFCYYSDALDKVTSLETIKERVDYLVVCGITEVDLSGGESSIHKDWFAILHYCTSKNLNISTLSNGSMFHDKVFIMDSFNHGLKEIMFSLHGYDEESHDRIVGHKGAFDKICKAIRNANDIGILVRINCTVSYDNHENLYRFVDLLEEFVVFEVNFLTLNYWGSAGDLKRVDYNEITDNIKNAIDDLRVPLVNVRYTPYCFMKGYEQYVCNIYQHIYDLYDWNVGLYDMDVDPKEYKESSIDVMYSKARDNRTRSYYKKDECKTCKFYYICDGLENGCDVEVHPEEGEYIKDVNYYRKGYYETTHKKS